MGTRNITVTGKTCQSWALNSPHRVDADINDHSFPDGSKKAARNYCRNPRPAYYTNVWCYTEDLVVEWEFCDICPDSFEGYSGMAFLFLSTQQSNHHAFVGLTYMYKA